MSIFNQRKGKKKEKILKDTASAEERHPRSGKRGSLEDGDSRKGNSDEAEFASIDINIRK